MLTLIHKIVGGSMLFALITVTLLWQNQAGRARKFENQAIRANAELARISSERNEQRTVTTRNITKAREDQQAVKVIVKRVETAPLPGNCDIPAEVTESAI